MILIGLGGNLASRDSGPPRRTLTVALERLAGRGARTVRRSRWYRSAPVPDDGGPWYTNAVAHIDTERSPRDLLLLLLEVEAEFGRVRAARNAPRTIDLDLVAYHDLSTNDVATPAGAPELPHPRMHERAFVLLPLAEIAPDWRHPRLGLGVAELIDRLPPGQRVEPIPEPT